MENTDPIIEPAPEETTPPPTTATNQSTRTNKSAAAAAAERSSEAVDVLLKAVGDAPILKKKKYWLPRSRDIRYIVAFLHKCFAADVTASSDSATVFIYVNQSFQPSADTAIGTLYDCFGSDGKLVLYYSKQPAYG